MRERDEREEEEVVVEEKMEIALGAKGGDNNDDTRRKQQRQEEMDETAAEVKVVLLQLCKGYNSNRKLQIAAAYLKTIFIFLSFKHLLINKYQSNCFFWTLALHTWKFSFCLYKLLIVP